MHVTIDYFDKNEIELPAFDNNFTGLRIGCEVEAEKEKSTRESYL